MSLVGAPRLPQKGPSPCLDSPYFIGLAMQWVPPTGPKGAQLSRNLLWDGYARQMRDGPLC